MTTSALIGSPASVDAPGPGGSQMPDFGDLFAGLPPLAGVILAAPILLVRMLRRHPLGRSSPPAPHIRDLEPRRV